MSVLRHRGKNESCEEDDAVMEELHQLRVSHDKYNHFFKGLFIFLSVSLGVARVVLLVYAYGNPYSLSHHSEWQEQVGSTWLLELSSASSLLLMAYYMALAPLPQPLKPSSPPQSSSSSASSSLFSSSSSFSSFVSPFILYFTFLINILLLGWLFISSPPNWLHERGYFFVIYFPGFSILYAAVCWYARRLICDPDLDTSLHNIISSQPVQNV